MFAIFFLLLGDNLYEQNWEIKTDSILSSCNKKLLVNVLLGKLCLLSFLYRQLLPAVFCLYFIIY